jgi:hypothetical protein
VHLKLSAVALFGLAPVAVPLFSPPAVAQAAPLAAVQQQGNTVVINDRSVPAAWVLSTDPTLGTRISLAQPSLQAVLGLEVGSVQSDGTIPIRWYTPGNQLQADTLPVVFTPGSPQSYVDIATLARRDNWTLEYQGTTLYIKTPAATLQSFRLGKQTWGQRLVLDLDRPTPWQLVEEGDRWLLDLQAALTPTAQRWAEQNGLRVQALQGRSRLVLPVASRSQVQLSSLGGPSRLVLDFQGQALATPSPASVATSGREVISGADSRAGADVIPGLNWQKTRLRVGNTAFPVNLVSLRLSEPGLKLAPIWSRRGNDLEGTAGLLRTSQEAGAIAAINAGFFNRNTELPLGALRRDGLWYSGPILNRGAIAWDERGNVIMGRLQLQEVLISDNGQRLPLTALNSGYVKAGVARYTPEWGPTYRALTGSEVVLVVRQGQLVERREIQKDGPAVAIPADGYLVVARAANSLVSGLQPGSGIQIDQQNQPGNFAAYPNVVGAGPLLLQGGRIVLDARSEGFSPAFVSEQAPRSAVGRRADGSLILVTVHERPGGDGPSLGEMAQAMSLLGAVDALNLDGGSSTSLVLQDRLVNRTPTSAARVHNGLAVLVTSPVSSRAQ